MVLEEVEKKCRKLCKEKPEKLNGCDKRGFLEFHVKRLLMPRKFRA